MENDAQQTVAPDQMPVAPKSKSRTGLLILLLILVLVTGAAFAYVISSNSSKTSNNKSSYGNMQVKPTSAIQGTSSSDTQLDKDTKEIDSSMKSLDSEVITLDGGLNDSPTDLSQ